MYLGLETHLRHLEPPALVSLVLQSHLVFLKKGLKKRKYKAKEYV